ncbi:hypothetical protein OG235_27995 [Streptomyces sp. NBC_00024]|uniref:hypothetical protein n=1 Tax=Streptomyces sp. NBC_00024 TaxID=2903612 RepID=UPI003245E1D3
MSDRKRILIDAPSEMTVLAARHLDATEGPVQVGRTVDTATRSAITTVLRYIATAHNAPAVEAPTAAEERPVGDIRLTRHLGRGVVVDAAPPRARIALTLLTNSSCMLAMRSIDHIDIANQVLYRVVGYDPTHASLIVDLVEDWRPKPTAQLSEAEVEDNPPVQCWHTEPSTPCDWDVCRQPERLAAGDRGTDPAREEQP